VNKTLKSIEMFRWFSLIYAIMFIDRLVIKTKKSPDRRGLQSQLLVAKLLH
jgi:hypothetical protein